MKSWNEIISPILETPEMKLLKEFIKKRRQEVKVFPEGKDTFNAFNYTPYPDIKVCIIGQDPYHTVGFAHGLAFSSLGKETPPSLQNIFKEIFASVEEEGITFENYFPSNDLTPWTKQGVFLYNTILTVEEGKPLSHEGKGWEILTEVVINALNDHPSRIIFMLWGNNARKYKNLITDPKHLILESTHPSPLSANQGFIGCNHFKIASDDLLLRNKDVTNVDLREYFDDVKALQKIREVLKNDNKSIEKAKKHIIEKIQWNLSLHFSESINWSTKI